MQTLRKVRHGVGQSASPGQKPSDSTKKSTGFPFQMFIESWLIAFFKGRFFGNILFKGSSSGFWYLIVRLENLRIWREILILYK